MNIVNLEKLKASVKHELEEIREQISDLEDELDGLCEEENIEQYRSLEKDINKLRGRHRGLRQALDIADELAISL